MKKTVLKIGKKGFTLVELLIVVAIIGVLATQGVPAYRRMIQKARKGEAKVLLGNIGTAEAAFFSEHQTYGNNITIMGAQMDGNAATLQYIGGFRGAISTNCTELRAAGTVFPAAMANYTGYPLSGSSMVGRTTIAANAALCNVAAAATNAAVGAYTAGAFGNIQVSGGAVTCPAAVSGTCDAWTITEARLLDNALDGTF